MKNGKEVAREIKFRIWSGRRMIYDGGLLTKGNRILVENKGKQNLSIPMQFTGLKDKNGKEIYEGDIVKSICGTNWILFWDNNAYSYMLKEIDREIHQTNLYDEELEVIGNIYENPELLKESK